MRPHHQEVLNTVQQSLLTYVLPELQSDYARTELMVSIAMLGIAGGEWDGAAQRVVDDNAALRLLAGRAANALAAYPDAAALVVELRTLSAERDASVRISALSDANARLRDAVARTGVWLQDRGEPELRMLRSAIIDYLREQAEARSYHLMGPRADG